MLKKMDKPLLIISILLLIIGLVMIFSASNVTSFMKYKVTPYHFFNRQLFFLGVSLFISIVMLKFNTKAYGYISWLITLVLIGLLVVVLFYGKLVNQARSWLNIMGIQFQPSEFVKIASIVWMSHYISIKKNNGFKSYLPLFGVILVNAILILLQPDLGTTIIYLAIIFMMFLSCPINSKIKKRILLLGGIGIVIIILLLMNNGIQVFFERQLQRFDFTAPCSEEKFYTTGTQVCNGYIAFNNGGLTGLGLGNSTQKYLYLPEAYTDFIFAIITEELGFLGAGLILLMIFLVLWRIFLIAKKSDDQMGRLMCYGIFWYILLHTLINLGGVMGLMPLTGVPLPFMSYGGSFLICLVVSLTICQKVCIESK